MKTCLRRTAKNQFSDCV